MVMKGPSRLKAHTTQLYLRIGPSKQKEPIASIKKACRPFLWMPKRLRDNRITLRTKKEKYSYKRSKKRNSRKGKNMIQEKQFNNKRRGSNNNRQRKNKNRLNLQQILHSQSSKLKSIKVSSKTQNHKNWLSYRKNSPTEALLIFQKARPKCRPKLIVGAIERQWQRRMPKSLLRPLKLYRTLQRFCSQLLKKI